MREEYMIERGGRRFVLYAGLLEEAHARGLRSIETELLQVPGAGNGEVAIARAVVRTEEGKFSGIGDASPGNVSSAIVPHIIRMAETQSGENKGELPATRKQLNYLEALIADTVEYGLDKFEEMVGKPISELSRGEASEWIGRLSGKAA